LGAIVKQKLKQAIADAMYSEIESKQARYYYYLGRTVDFADVNEQPNSSVDYESKVRNEIVLLKALTAADLSFVVPRSDWAFGKFFNAYDISVDEGSEGNPKYCLITETFNVYKCLDNGGTLNPSTIPPSTTDLSPQQLSDGYTWKFMYNIPRHLANKFLTGEFMPVMTALRSRFFSNGSIDNITIEDGGSGYSQGATTLIVSGDGVDATMLPVIVGGQLVNVVITNAGFGYTNATITINTSDPFGTGAQVSVNLSTGDYTSSQAVVEMLAIPGTIERIVTTLAGTGYPVNTLLTIEGDGSDATVTYTLGLNGELTNIIMTNIGKNYTVANIVISQPPAPGGTAAILYANISPPLGHGRDAVSELFATSIMFFGNLTRESYGGVKIDNDYRQYGLIRNPRSPAFGTNISDPISKNSYALISEFGVGITIQDFPPGTILRDSLTNDYTITSVTVGTSISGMTVTSASGSQVVNGVSLTSTNLWNTTGTFSVGATFADFPVGTVCTDGAANVYLVYFSDASNVYIFTKNGNPVSVLPGVILTKSNVATPQTFTIVTATTIIKTLTVQNSQRREKLDSIIGSTCYAVTGAFDLTVWIADTVIRNITDNHTYLIISSDTSVTGVTSLLVLPKTAGVLTAGAVINIVGTGTNETIVSVLGPNIDKNTGEILFIDNRPSFIQTPDQTVSFRTVIEF